jgi:two-component system OmpR family response regulator
MAQKTRLNSNEVANLLMDSPVTVCEWMQNGMLHAEVSGVIKRPFTMGDVAQFTKDNGMQFNRPDQSKLRILIINNDLQSAHRLVEILDTLSETAESVAVHSTFDAGRKISEFRPDIVLIGAGLPRHECLEICRQIKSGHATRHVKVVVVLETSDHNHRQRMFMAGADSCLENPVSNQALLDVMGLCLNPVREYEDAYREST